MTKEEITKDLKDLDDKIEANRKKQDSLKNRYNEFIQYYGKDILAKARKAFDWDLMMKCKAGGGIAYLDNIKGDPNSGYMTACFTRDCSCSTSDMILQFGTKNGHINAKYHNNTGNWEMVFDLSLSTKDNVEAINFNAQRVAPLKRISEDFDKVVDGIYATTKKYYEKQNNDLNNTVKGCDCLMMPWEEMLFKKEKGA